jgi:hypothetical protein
VPSSFASWAGAAERPRHSDRQPARQPLAKTTGIVARQLLRGQTNFAKMIWKFDKVYNADRQYSEHLQPVAYQLPPPAEHPVTMPDPRQLYVHHPPRRRL